MYCERIGADDIICCDLSMTPMLSLLPFLSFICLMILKLVVFLIVIKTEPGIEPFFFKFRFNPGFLLVFT